MFRYKPAIPLSYDRQGYVHFQSRLYAELSEKDRARIRKLCQEAAGQHWRALLEFVTTDNGATRIEQKYYVSRATLYRYLQKYYVMFPKKL